MTVFNGDALLKFELEMDIQISIRNGALSGTILSVLPNIHSADIAKTVLLAAIGATVSVGVTMILKWLVGFRRK